MQELEQEVLLKEHGFENDIMDRSDKHNKEYYYFINVDGQDIEMGLESMSRYWEGQYRDWDILWLDICE